MRVSNSRLCLSGLFRISIFGLRIYVKLGVIMKTILIGSDHAGFLLKEKIKKYLEKSGFRVEDVGTYSEERCDYPEFGARLARKVSGSRNKRGILICYSGIGVSIVANKFPGVRAALCHDTRAAELSRRHNNSNVLVLGAGFVGVPSARAIAKVWLSTGFEGGRHLRRVKLIGKIEKGLRG